MFSTCVARGIAAKLVYKTVGGKVETSLYCSTASATSTAAAAAAAHVPQKKGRKRPDNERRRMRREAWQQRRFSSKPASVTKAPTAAAVSTVSEKDCSTAATETAARATAVVKTVQCLAQAAMPAAKGAATAAPSTAAATPPRGWVLEPRNGLVVMARRIPEHSLESPETIRDPDAAKDVDISLVSLTEERELDDALGMRTAVLYGQESPPSYAAAAAGGTIPPTAVLVDAASEQSTEEDVRAESVEPVYKLPPTPPPWSSHFSDHYMRVLCTFCFSGNRDLRNDKCSDCYRLEREKFKKMKEAMKK
jgi:hypothetical protein